MKTLLTYLLIIICSNLLATDYYVAISGSNNNAGTISAPWRTIQYGVDQLSAGDQLYIKAGLYAEKINIYNSGSATSRILISNYNNDLVILDGTGNTNQIAMIDLYDISYVTIQGLELRNNQMIDAQGIQVAGGGDGVYVLNNINHNIDFSTDPNTPVNAATNAQGIIIYGSIGTDAITDLKINGNEIHSCLLGYSEALAVNGNVDGFEILNNYVHDNSNIGIDVIGHENTATSNDQARNGQIKYNIVHGNISPYATSGGIYVDGGKDLIIENNISYDNGYGIEVGCENIGKTTSNIIIRNNLIYDNEKAGLSLGGFDYPATGKVTHTTVTGNTFFQNDNSNSFSGELYLSYSENCEISNNIFYTGPQNTYGYVELSQVNLIVDYNTIYCPDGATNFEADWNSNFYFGFSNYQSGTGHDTHSTFGDPLFVDNTLGNLDLHILAGSP